jgi:hypothetical protein
MTFRVGQEVICVDDLRRVSWRESGFFERFRKFKRLGHNLNSGEVYTITSITETKCAASRIVYRMLHVDGAWHFGHREIGFPSFQFRPAVKVKTDISIFTKMLTPKRENA